MEFGWLNGWSKVGGVVIFLHSMVNISLYEYVGWTDTVGKVVKGSAYLLNCHGRWVINYFANK